MCDVSGQARRLERQHTALDLHDRKCGLNLARLHKAGIQGVRTVSGDACELDEVLTSFDAMLGEPVKFDTVFIDAPCSGTGTMRRHPEIPWRLTEKDVTVELPKLQLTMLKEAAERVAAGGRAHLCDVLGLRRGEHAGCGRFPELSRGCRL